MKVGSILVGGLGLPHGATEAEGAANLKACVNYLWQYPAFGGSGKDSSHQRWSGHNATPTLTSRRARADSHDHKSGTGLEDPLP